MPYHGLAKISPPRTEEARGHSTRAFCMVYDSVKDDTVSKWNCSEGRTGVRRIEKATIDKGLRKIEEEKRFRIEK